jgi:hypothetical protein
VTETGLLERFKPQLRYDSNEAFFADSVTEWTDNPANELRREPVGDRQGELLAAATPGAGEAQLNLAFLGESSYVNGKRVEPTDIIGCARRDYRDQYVALRRDRRYANRIYGRAKEDLGRLWLQYWFFYFFNDYSLAGGFGLHEGDWEMIQLRMSESGDLPDIAVYAQHRWAEVARWEEVEKAPDQPDTPVVYVARGSHASYFQPGYHETEAWYDLADGKRKTPQLDLETIGDEEPNWAAWPGRWGGTRPRLAGLEQPSPTAPCRHPQWEHPAALLDQAREATHGAAAPPPPVHVSRADGYLHIVYDFSSQDVPTPDRLIVTVNSEDDDVQPRTFTFVVDAALKGTITTTVELDEAKRYDVFVSAADSEGRPTESKLTLIRAAGAQEPGPAGALPARPSGELDSRSVRQALVEGSSAGRLGARLSAAAQVGPSPQLQGRDRMRRKLHSHPV